MSDAARELHWRESLLPSIVRKHQESLRKEVVTFPDGSGDMTPIFVVWDDARWDEQTCILFARVTYYGANVTKDIPFSRMLKNV